MRQNFIGMVVSNAMQKTVKVKVTRPVVHPIVRKVNFSPVAYCSRMHCNSYRIHPVVDH